jgi:hypothetical protein
MSAGRWIAFSGKNRKFGRGPRHFAIFVLAASAALLGNMGGAQSGPCSKQIAQLEQQVGAAKPGPQSGPTAPQSLGAQLHHQPTPSSVGQAEHTANKDGDAALERAKQADASGDAAACNQALVDARRLYEINQ